jgi:hypothetical protein
VLALQSISSSLSLHNSLIKNASSRAQTLVAADLVTPEPLYRLHLRYTCALMDCLRPVGCVFKVPFLPVVRKLFAVLTTFLNFWKLLEARMICKR